MRFSELSQQVGAGAHIRRSTWPIGDYVSELASAGPTAMPKYTYYTAATQAVANWAPSDDDKMSEDWSIEC